MAKTTELTAENLLTYPSAKLTKTPDGGGLMRGTPLTGAVNELFDPTSDIELVNGGFDARLIYPAVLTDNLAELYGAYVIVGERPEMDNVSILITPAAYYGERYDNARNRFESYSAPTIESRMTLMGRALAGSKMVQCYQRDGEPLPHVGERYCLKSDKAIEYFRIAKVSGEVRTFTDPNSGKDFQRLVVTIISDNVLQHDHQGAVYPRQSYADAETKVLETQVANSTHYYGIRPTTEDATAGSTTIKVDSVYEQLAPTTSNDTAWADQYPAGQSLWVPLGAEQELYNTWWPGGNFYLPYTVQPGSVKVRGYTDNATGQLVSSSGAVIEVDYASGLLRNVPAHTLNIHATPAARYVNAAYSTYINIDQTNQSTEWAPFLLPKPAPGSLRINWRSAGSWYALTDHGDYLLRDSSNKRCGLVTRDGSAQFSLPDMPDVGSQIVLMWVPIDYYKTIDDKDAGSVIEAQEAGASVVLHDDADPRPIKPGTANLAWDSQGATDDGHAGLVGIDGLCNYADASIVSDAINAANVTLTSKRYSGKVHRQDIESLSSTFTLNIPNDEEGGAQRIQPGTLRIAARITAVGNGTLTTYAPYQFNFGRELSAIRG